MDLVLKKKMEQGDVDPLIIMVKDEQKKSRFIKKVAIGETIQVDDQLGYKIMSTYPGLFDIKAPEYKTKVMKPE